MAWRAGITVIILIVFFCLPEKDVSFQFCGDSEKKVLLIYDPCEKEMGSLTDETDLFGIEPQIPTLYFVKLLNFLYTETIRLPFTTIPPEQPPG